MSKKNKTVDEKGRDAIKGILRYQHSNRNLYKSIINILPPIKDSTDKFDPDSVDLATKAVSIFDSFGEISRKWSFSIHWLYTVCNPNITEIKNVKYSPIYENFATDFPKDRFGELSHLDDSENGLVYHIDKLVADKRFVGSNTWDFGTAWNDEGYVIKKDINEHPIYDGFSGLLAERMTKIQNHFQSKPNLDRNFQGFLIAHTRDFQSLDRNGSVEHKESHFHGVLDLPRPQSRYQIMEALGVKFDDFTETFQWMSDEKPDNLNARINSFLGSLQGIVENYKIPDYYDAALKYLVHQSSGAIKDQKTPYNVNEVISWLPSESTENYSQIAGVYNNEIVAKGANQEVVDNLHSPFNLFHHTIQWVGDKDSNKAFTYDQLTRLRKLGKKGVGKSDFSVKTQNLIISLLVSWIRLKKIEFVDLKVLIHMAFDDFDADNLLSNVRFVSKINSILDDEKEAIISDSDYDRKMLTIFVTANTGGIGKTRLATELAKYYDKGRMPHMAATKDEGKTFDAYQNYANERSSIIDEIDPNSFSWSQLKDLLDPHKVPGVSSRFVNQNSWNVHHTFLTNVYSDGVSGYVRQVLRYAPGVGKLGYLEKSDEEWDLKEHDSKATRSYLSQLSQLLRRIPVEVRLSSYSPTETKIVVSVINFRPGGRDISRYGYVHTNRSERVFKFVISDGLSETNLKYLAESVSFMIQEIQLKAQSAFKSNPDILLDDLHGFISNDYDLGVQFNGAMPSLHN